MKTFNGKFATRGFSMIEVLISVVVLGFGLLALAALQTSIIRSSSEAKAQTVALQLAKDKVEDLRSFKTLLEYQNNLTSGNDAVTESAVAYARTWVIARCVYTTAGAQVCRASDTDNIWGYPEESAIITGPTPAAIGGVAVTSNNEYKRVAVTVSWTDSNGATQSIGLEDAIGAVSPGDGSKVMLNNTSSTEPRYPRVLIYDPSNTPGVIPIAVGNGTDTAATNPKPEVEGNNSNKKATETRFDVLTYAGLNNGTAQAQSRVETAVVGCTCNKGNAVTTDIAYRPSYWNGFRYTVPRIASYAPISAAATIPNNAPPQSQYCNTCCRDHHDPSGVTGPKFDPRRTTHTHYAIVNGALVVAGDGDDYIEACRLIRVDGIFRVAADLNNDYFNLLRTRNDGTASAYAPTTAATANYQSMVLGYLDQRIVSQSASSAYNTLLSGTAVDALEATYSIDDPAKLSMQPNNDFKWLHSRGLFIDYLEPEALDKITTAKQDCQSPQTAESCVLRFVPFTSINLSELSYWTPLGGTELKVTNNDFSGSTGGTPVRGKVEPGTNPTVTTPGTDPATQTAYSKIYSSNSGVAVLGYAIDADESQLMDTQVFDINGGSSPPNAGSFFVNLTGYTFGLGSSNPTVGTTYSSSDCNPTVQSIIPYICSVTQVGVSATVTVGKYNYEGSKVAYSATAGSSGISCTKGNTTLTNIGMIIPAGSSNARRVCKNFTVDSTSVGAVGAVANEGKGAETTQINGVFADTGTVNIGLSAGTDVQSTLTECKYTGTQSNGDTIPDSKLTLTWSDPCL